jgi:DNA helicase II / ATP-dependent DNA helicase PcrA
MGKRVILAVAGSGKTTHIIDGLSLDKKSLIITYTINNQKHLRNKIISKFGYFPSNITLLSYFTFLYSFCYRPLVSNSFPSKGISFQIPPAYLRKSNPLFYRSSTGNLYSNRVADLIIGFNACAQVISRIEKYFDEFIIDEAQDIGGRDFNFLENIARADLDILLVGDFYQHTFDTSRDGRTNATLYSDLDGYIQRLSNAGFTVDTDLLKKSYRCSPNTCEFITSKLGIDIHSHRNDETQIIILGDEIRAAPIINDSSIVKLFYRQHYLYECFSRNWGECKGEDDYHDICIVLNQGTQTHLERGTLHNLAPTTKNKLYVALSRAHGSVYLISQTLFDETKNNMS